jgi:hypothetical protein
MLTDGAVLETGADDQGAFVRVPEVVPDADASVVRVTY